MCRMTDDVAGDIWQAVPQVRERADGAEGGAAELQAVAAQVESESKS
jgi:hypothetical protein